MKKTNKVKELRKITLENIKEISSARLTGLSTASEVMLMAGQKEGKCSGGGYNLFWQEVNGKATPLILLKDDQLSLLENANL
jgi:hypothetical protein